MIIVGDVPASAAWYMELLGYERAGTSDRFVRLLGPTGRPELLLHHAEVEAHPGVSHSGKKSRSSSVLFYVRVRDAHAVYRRARQLNADLIDEPHINPNSRSIEFSLRDLDGHALTISQPKQGA